MENNDKKLFLNVSTIAINAILLFLGITMLFYSCTNMVDNQGNFGGTFAMILISGLLLIATSLMFAANYCKKCRTLQLATFIVDTSIIIMIFVFAIVIVAVSRISSLMVYNLTALVLLIINYILVDVKYLRDFIKEIKDSSAASAAAAAAASIAEAENLKEKQKTEEEIVQPEVEENK